MNLATMRAVATALQRQIKADTSGEETGAVPEKVLDTGEMPKPAIPAAVEPEAAGPGAAPETKEEPTIDSTPAPAAATKELRLKQLQDIRDEVLKTNNANIQDIVQKIGVDNIKFIVKDVSGPNAKIVTKLERDSKPIVLGINLVDSEGKKNTSDQAYLVADNKEQDIRASANDPKNGLKLFMPDQFEELFSQIVPSKGKPEAGSDTKPEADKAPAVDTKAKPPAPAVPPKAPAASEDRWKPLSDKLTEKDIPEDVAKKVLEFFGAQTKKVHLAEDDLLSEMPRPSGTKLETVKFTDWLKEQGFDEEITRKIIEAVAEIAAQGTKQQLFAGSGNVGGTLTQNMGYAAKPKKLSGQAKSSGGPKPAVDTGVGSDDQDDEVDDEDGGSNKKRVDQWAEVKKNPESWEVSIPYSGQIITLPVAKVIDDREFGKAYILKKPNGKLSIPISINRATLVSKIKTSSPEIPPAVTTVEPEEKPETELSQESKKLYRSLDVVSGETLGRILSLNGEYKTLNGGASDLMAIYKFASPELQDKIKKNVKGASEILTQIPAIKQKYDSITVEQAGTILSNAFTEFDNQNARENQAKIDKSKESSVAAPAPETQKTTTPEEQTDEQKALAHIKKKIKTAALSNKTAIRIDSLYEKGLVTPSNVIDLLNKAKKDPEIEKYIASAGSKPLEQIIFKKGLATKARPESEAPSKGELDISKLKLGGETDEEEPPEDEDGEGPPEEEVDGEPEQEVPRVAKKVGKKGSKEPKQAAPVEDLEGIKKKATFILKKYAKKEGKEGKDLKTFIENIEKAENKAAIVQIFDIALEEGNAFKASEELNGDPSEEDPQTAALGTDTVVPDDKPEVEMTPERLKYGKKNVTNILKKKGIQINKDIKKEIEDATDEADLKNVFLNTDDFSGLAVELTKAFEDYDSKQVQKESITRPMFVLKEGIFRLNR